MSLIKKAKTFLKDKLLTRSDAAETGRPYDFYLIFGQNEADKFPWIRANWDKLFQPYINSLIAQTEKFKETAIRVAKYQAERRISKKDGQEFIYHTEMKLGKLRWDQQSHEKWTLPDGTNEYFQDFELWTPIWTTCEKMNIAPDIFISITNENAVDNSRDVQFGYLIVVAVAKNLKADSKTVLKELSEKINSRITVLKDRKWGKTEKAGNWTFVNGIQDTFSNGIYKGQNLHSINFSELEFEPVWEVIYKEK